ncbi:FAD binding domain-containing protein [Rhodococcus sp. HNM0569]|uniref:FAD binding domain-containing protein n=1 Tax=Rhodococcus sp. HNM0569 TaxID=2716340 RepID=UPI00146F6BEE|nr:FAD binding domain-containing protein [Rhodococcus sp. HNM0569]NLU82221.1 dehydrogenase [Rhodococcus sp. HNM0569]
MRTQALGAGWVAQSQSATAPFRLHRPGTVAAASDLLARYDDATVAAGCSDLVARMREGESVTRLVSVRRIPELRAITFDDGVLRIGSAVTHHDGSTHSLVTGTVPGLADAWSRIATVRIRYTGTVGGNLMARRTRYEMPLILGALRARREHDATGRLLTAVAVDTSDLLWFGYERSMRPTTTLALAVWRSGTGLRVRAVSGSEYRPGYVLEAEAATATPKGLDVHAVAAELAGRLPDDCADYSGSADYRRHVTAVLARRLLAAAAAGRAYGEGNAHDRA